MSCLFLMRGLPGSGKSTLAKAMLQRGEVDCHFEADMWVNYSLPYGDRRIPQAHENCMRLTHIALSNGKRVVVSNTFSRLWELQPYLDMAAKLGIEPVVMVATGSFKNVHGVPQEKVQAMRDKWEDLINAE